MELAEFENLVESILTDVPQIFKKNVENLSIIIDETSILPSAVAGRKNNRITLALYQGVPITKRGYGKPVFPDRITIYKKAIESVSGDDESIRTTTKRVVLHELGHYFGLDEEKLAGLGY
jgi:predicted Zn-dependent protease with MMP-like domain